MLKESGVDSVGGDAGRLGGEHESRRGTDAACFGNGGLCQLLTESLAAMLGAEHQVVEPQALSGGELRQVEGEHSHDTELVGGEKKECIVAAYYLLQPVKGDGLGAFAEVGQQGVDGCECFRCGGSYLVYLHCGVLFVCSAKLQINNEMSAKMADFCFGTMLETIEIVHVST